MAKDTYDFGKERYLHLEVPKPGMTVLLVFLTLFVLARIVSYVLFPDFLASSGLLTIIMLVALILAIVFTYNARHYYKPSRKVWSLFTFLGIAALVLGVIVIAGNITALVFEILANKQHYDITAAIWSLVVAVVLGVSLILFGISTFKAGRIMKARLMSTISYHTFPFSPLFIVSFVLSVVSFLGFTAINYFFGVGGPAILRELILHVDWMHKFELTLNQPLKFYFEMGDIALNLILIGLFFTYGMNIAYVFSMIKSVKVKPEEKVVVKEVIKEVTKEKVKEAPVKEKIVEKEVIKEVPILPKKETTPIKEMNEKELKEHYDTLIKDGFISNEEKELRLKAITQK